jgi:hypothetical protein
VLKRDEPGGSSLLVGICGSGRYYFFNKSLSMLFLSVLVDSILVYKKREFFEKMIGKLAY